MRRHPGRSIEWRSIRTTNEDATMFFLLRKFWFFLLLGVAAGVPYVVSQGKDSLWAQKVRSWMASRGSSEEPPGSETPANSGGTGTVVPPSIPLEHVFHYQWTPQQVMANWPSVTRVYEGEWLGLRVPLTTGTSPGDLAGSLTYYFDAENRLRRITFVGVTGDAQPLIRLVTTRFGLQAEPSTAAGLYVARWNGQPKSAVRLAYPPLLTSNHPRRRLEVTLELNRPATGYRLSNRFRQTLEQDRLVGRWKPF